MVRTVTNGMDGPDLDVLGATIRSYEAYDLLKDTSFFFKDLKNSRSKNRFATQDYVEVETWSKLEKYRGGSDG